MPTTRIMLECNVCGNPCDFEIPFSNMVSKALCECPTCGELMSVSLTVQSRTLTPLYREEEWLRNEYLSKNRTMAEIADEFCVSPMTVYGWLQKHGIETLPRGRRQ